MSKSKKGQEGIRLKKKTKKAYSATRKRVVHELGKGRICTTDVPGLRRSPLDLVLDASEGFIPLWEQGKVLRWEFERTSLEMIDNSSEVKAYVRGILEEALLEWGSSAPIGFTESNSASDFKSGSNRTTAAI